MCWRFSAGERAARPPLRIFADETFESRDSCLIVGQYIGGGRIAVEPAGLVLSDPDLTQVAADAVAFGERVRRLSA
jgi:hypothetical protein